MSDTTTGEVLSMLNSDFKRRLQSQTEWDAESVREVWTEELMKAMRSVAMSDTGKCPGIKGCPQCECSCDVCNPVVRYAHCRDCGCTPHDAGGLTEEERQWLKAARVLSADWGKYIGVDLTGFFTIIDRLTTRSREV